jgi:hypothetical protein
MSLRDVALIAAAGELARQAIRHALRFLIR